MLDQAHNLLLHKHLIRIELKMSTKWFRMSCLKEIHYDNVPNK
jgi:hypothetical protein